MKTSNLYTTAPVRQVMFKTALAMIPGTLAMSGYNIADTWFVGRLPGAEPLAAMGFTFPVIMLIGCVFRGLAIGVMTTTAQALGAGRHDRAARLTSTGLLVITFFSVMLAILGMVGSRWLFELCGAEGETLELVTGYMRIWFFGCMTASLSMTGNDLLVALGASRMASFAMIAGMVVNVILDPIFIFGWCGLPATGIRGAALATVLSQCFSTILVLTLLARRYRLLRFEAIPWRAAWSAARLIIGFAIPATLGMLMIPLGTGIVTRITAEFGDAAVAATAAAGRVEMIAFVVPMSVGIALTPFIGQNYGAKLYTRIREGQRFVMRFATFFLLASALVATVFSRPIAVFFSVDPEVQRIMAQYLRIVAWGLWGVEVHRFAGFIYTGCGRPAVSGWLNALRIGGLLVPFSLVAYWLRSLEGLFFARLAADVLAALIGWRMASGMTRRLLQRDAAGPAQ